MIRPWLCIAGLLLLASPQAAGQSEGNAEGFWRQMLATLPQEESYAYHARLKGQSVHVPRRHAEERAAPGEVEIRSSWKLVRPAGSGDLLEFAVNDFRDYLKTSMGLDLAVSSAWPGASPAIRVAVKAQWPELGKDLHKPKDYRLRVSPDGIDVCGFDERGALYGLLNLESRMNMRGGPFLQAGIDSVRKSLFRTRMVLNWLGWMEWSDNYLDQLLHDGFDAIYASAYANPNGVPLQEPGYRNMRTQDPARMQDLLRRCARFGIKVYAPILYRYTGTPENAQGLRELVRDIATRFPSIRGYVLLTEGFYYDEWFGAGGRSEQALRQWAVKWSEAVKIVVEECHKVDPAIDILPWEYNIDFRPQRAGLKRYVITQLPRESTPLLTWENGKSFQLDQYRGYLRDYSINVVGPAEVTEAQIDEAGKRGMKVFSKVDTFASWQFGTIPYLPVPFQWHRRYEALVRFGVDGTHESWSNGYKPNFVTNLRSWYCWTDAPPLESLLKSMARQIFGPGQEDSALKAWSVFSEAIQSLPDTGPSMGTNAAVSNPLFFKEPYPRTMTIRHSWWDQQKWSSWQASYIHPEWPYSPTFLTFIPDFTNRVNRAEQYALGHSGLAGIENQKISGEEALALFRKYLAKTADGLEAGLKEYRRAALSAPQNRRTQAFREVLIAEHMQLMLRSSDAILAFEDNRFRFEKSGSRSERLRLLDEMAAIARQELPRTRKASDAARRDSRLGYEFEHDYIYTPRVIEEKIRLLEAFIADEYPAARKAVE